MIKSLEADFGNIQNKNEVYTFKSEITWNEVHIELLPDDIIVGDELRRIVRDEDGNIPNWVRPLVSNQDYIRITPSGKVYGKSGKELKTRTSAGKYIIRGLDEKHKQHSISVLKELAIAFCYDKYSTVNKVDNLTELKNGMDITTLVIPDIHTTRFADGKHVDGYKQFQHMHIRCSEEYKVSHHTYKDCFVSEEFNNFEYFKLWYDNNIYHIFSGKLQLDKDITGFGYYSEKTCLLVPDYINTYFINGNSVSGLTFRNGRFIAHCSKFKSEKKSTYISSHNTEKEAHKAWADFKNEQLQKVVLPYFINDVHPEDRSNPMVLKVIEAIKNYKFV